MKITMLVPTVFEAVAIRCTLPNRYAGDEDDPLAGYPEGAGYDRAKKVLTLRINLPSALPGRPAHVEGWPPGASFTFNGFKVCDEGCYELMLMEPGYATVVTREGYVPRCLPGGGGDYFEGTVGPDGSLTFEGQPWAPDPLEVAAAFAREGSARDAVRR